MGLAAAQVRFLGLTARKADCEYGLSINAMQKMSLTREMSELTREYNSKLQGKNIAYYADGKYNKINYEYLMGNTNWLQYHDRPSSLKKDNSMVLTDYLGQVVLSEEYAKAITSAGASAMNAKGQGGTFKQSYIPAILVKLMNINGLAETTIQKVMNGEKPDDKSYKIYTNVYTTITNEQIAEGKEVAAAQIAFDFLKSAVDFYLPILQAAANNGWTTEYNTEINTNTDYVSDALVSGTFQLEIIDEYGEFEPGSSLTYFLTNGTIETNTTSEKREEITAWYDEEKARISEKETWLDIENQDLSTELESIKTEMESVKSLIDDATSSVFDWGGS